MELKYKGRLTALLIIILIASTLQYSNQLAIISLLTICLIWYGGLKYDRTEFLSQRDPLTNTYNRQYIYKSLPSLLKEASKKDKSVNILFIDIDRFKEINDNYGHLMGDRVLIEVANLLRKNVRTTDKIVRWGGDEFLLVFRDCDQRDLSKVIERIHLEVEMLCEKIELYFSLTIGISTFPNDGMIMGDLIKKADNDMYRIKRGERVFKAI